MCRSLLVLWIAVVCLGGCGTYPQPSEWRNEVKHVYSIDVDRPYDRVHDHLRLAIMSYGWGEDAHLHSEIYTETKQGSLWVYLYDPREICGFILDVGAAGESTSKVTVYAIDGFYARKSRAWLEAKLAEMLARNDGDK